MFLLCKLFYVQFLGQGSVTTDPSKTILKAALLWYFSVRTSWYSWSSAVNTTTTKLREDKGDTEYKCQAS